MASYTRLIEFKVKDTELTRAVNKLSKTLTNIDKTLIGIDKKLDHIARQGFGGIAKEATKAEKSVSKLGKAVKALSSPQGLARGAVSGAFGLLGGKKGEIARRVAELYAFDGVLRKLTNGSTGLPAFNRRVTEAATALAGFGLAHTGAIAAVVGGSAAILTGTKFFYGLGKGVRQAEANMIDFIKTSRQLGVGKGLRSLFPKGSLWGGDERDTSSMPFAGGKAAAAIEKELGRTFSGQTSPVTGYGAIGSLDTKRKALAQTQQIQEKLVALTGKHLQASIQVRKAMIGYNLELAKTKAVQGFVTADLWAMQKAWQGIVSTIKGAGNLVGGIFGGKFGGAGKGLGVITLSRGIEFLTGKLGFLNKAWIDNTNRIALWSARASEAITAVNIAYTGFSKVLGAAQWATGAITGFIRWEEQAMLSFRRINTARDNLDKRMAGLLDKGKNPFTGFGKLIRGESGERGVQAQLADRGESNQQRIARELEVQQRLLKATNTTAKDYVQIQKEIIRLEEQQTIEINKRRMMEVRAGKKMKDVYKDEIEKQTNKTMKLEQQEAKQRKKLQDEAARNYEKGEKDKQQAAEKTARDRKKRWRDAMRQERELANAQKRRGQQRMQAIGRFGENVMLGAGFPMLFGGGAGSVAGGLTGAVTQSVMGSKGFGAQILFSAVGQQIDAFAGKAMELGKALKDPTEALSMLSTMGIKVEESFSDHIKALVDLGRTHEAQALVNKEVAKIIGKDGVKALKDLGKANSDLMDKANKLRIKIMSDLAPAFMTLIGMADQLVNTVSGHMMSRRAQELDPAGYKIARDKANKAAIEFRRNEVMNNPNISGVNKFLFNKTWGAEMSAGTSTGARKEHDRVLFGESKKILQRLIPGSMGSDGSGGMGAGPLSDAVWESTKAKSFQPLTQKKQELERIIELGTEEAGIQQQIAEIVAAQGMTIGTIGEDELLAIENKVRNLELTKEQAAEVVKLEAVYKDIAATIEDGLVNAIEGAIKGTKTLGDVASSVLSQIANKMLKLGVNKLLTMIPGVGDFFKADGGPVSGGSPYIVGEKGPELFVPKSSGNIVPNHAMGGSMVVNVDASGSSAEGDDDRSRQLGELIGAAVQSEIIRQQRPGGTLY